MTTLDTPAAFFPAHEVGTTLRLLFPQWQGCTVDNIDHLLGEVPRDAGRLGYAVGTAVLAATLPAHDGPTATVPVDMSGHGLAERDGVDAKDVVATQLHAALQVIAAHGQNGLGPERIVTVGGECSVSVAPFASLAARYGDDLAVVWIDSHPDVGTPASVYRGWHAMAVSAITGHGDPDLVRMLPGVVDPAHVALAGVHSWTDDDHPNAAAWGISEFPPDQLRHDTSTLLTWLAATGCSKLAIHLDVDAIDSHEVVLGLGMEPHGLAGHQVARLLADLRTAADVVGFTVAEFIPRQVLRLQQVLAHAPLL